MDNIKFNKDKNFQITVIKPNSIKQFDFNDNLYLEKIFALDIFENIYVNNQNFNEILAEQLCVNKFKIKDCSTDCIFEDNEFIIEMIYPDMPDEFKSKDNFNELASLFNMDEKQIFGNVIFMKTSVPSEGVSMDAIDCNIKDLYQILFYRVNKKIVVYDFESESFHEELINDIDYFRKTFFDNKISKHTELPFLLHNINIEYKEFEYGEKLGKLLDKPVDKAFFYSRTENDYLVNLTKEEVVKIVKLSNFLDDFKPKEEYTNNEMDEHQRIIIKNRFRILNKIYNKYFPINNNDQNQGNDC